MDSPKPRKFFMHLHNVVSQRKMHLLSVAKSHDDHGYIEWRCSITVGKQTYSSEATPTKQAAKDLAAKEALVDLGIDIDTLRDGPSTSGGALQQPQ